MKKGKAPVVNTVLMKEGGGKEGIPGGSQPKKSRKRVTADKKVGDDIRSINEGLYGRYLGNLEEFFKARIRESTLNQNKVSCGSLGKRGRDYSGKNLAGKVS